MGDAGFFRGTSAEQDNRFTDKQKKLLKTLKFPENVSHKVDLKKVNLEVLKPWITVRINEILGVEDDVVIEFIFSQLEEENPDPRLMQINLTGFLNAKKAREFMGDLWQLLIDAQDAPDGIPPKLLELKKEEMKKQLDEEKQKVKEETGAIVEERPVRPDRPEIPERTEEIVREHSPRRADWDRGRDRERERERDRDRDRERERDRDRGYNRDRFREWYRDRHEDDYSKYRTRDYERNWSPRRREPPMYRYRRSGSKSRDQRNRDERRFRHESGYGRGSRAEFSSSREEPVRTAQRSEKRHDYAARDRYASEDERKSVCTEEVAESKKIEEAGDESLRDKTTWFPPETSPANVAEAFSEEQEEVAMKDESISSVINGTDTYSKAAVAAEEPRSHSQSEQEAVSSKEVVRKRSQSASSASESGKDSEGAKRSRRRSQSASSGSEETVRPKNADKKEPHSSRHKRTWKEVSKESNHDNEEDKKRRRGYSSGESTSSSTSSRESDSPKRKKRDSRKRSVSLKSSVKTSKSHTSKPSRKVAGDEERKSKTKCSAYDSKINKSPEKEKTVSKKKKKEKKERKDRSEKKKKHKHHKKHHKRHRSRSEASEDDTVLDPTSAVIKPPTSMEELEKTLRQKALLSMQKSH